MNSFEAASGGAPGTERALETQNVTEIFPGASQQKPVANRPARPRAAISLRKEPTWAKNGMEAGMATAEYAIATLAAVEQQKQT